MESTGNNLESKEVNTNNKLSKQDKYNLRTSSLVSRVQSERKRNLPKTPKPKTRPPPLSKYRRKTANHRERERMKDMNDAFEALRKAVPGEGEPDSKQTKVTTLKLALDYIVALRKVLGYDCETSELDNASSSRGSEFSEQCSSSEISQCDVTSCDQLNSDGESSSASNSGISSCDESSSTNDLDFLSPFDLGEDLCIDFDVDVALML